MGIKKIIITLICVLLLVSVAGCSDQPKNATLDDFYTITKNSDNKFDYTFEDKNGNILFEHLTFPFDVSTQKIILREGLRAFFHGSRSFSLQRKLLLH